MLKSLLIQNYAIIEKVQLNFDRGMIVITGETGAGKSIMMGALGLILGDRVQTNVLNPEEGNTVIEGVFSVDGNLPQDLAQEYDLNAKDITVRRVINPSGRSRAFVNDLPINLKNLTVIGNILIDIHRQFDNSWLFLEENQLVMLDILAGQQDQMASYSEQYSDLTKKKRELATLKSELAAIIKEQDYMQFQWDELSAADLDELDLSDLENEIHRMENMEEIETFMAQAHHRLLDSENSVVDQLRELARELELLPVSDLEKEEWLSRLIQSQEDLDALAVEFMDYSDSVDQDQEKLQVLQDKLNAIYHLQKKHNVTELEELRVLRDQLEKDLKQIESSDENILELEKSISDIEKELHELANTLTAGRRKAARRFEEEVESSLAELSMKKATFNIQLKTGELNAYGQDKIQFLFSANPGQEPQDFRKIASGGERSRLALCLKMLVAEELSMPTLVFDEIDSGVSGDVALKMGKMLKTISQRHQLIVITHSPQIAAQGEQHFYISKSDDGEKTKTEMSLLDRNARIHELAIMLSKNPPSQAAMDNAKDLLKHI